MPSSDRSARAPDPPPLPEGRAVAVPGVGELFVRLALEGDAPVVVLLHGWTVDADLNFHPVLLDLAATHRVVAPDLPGHGRSVFPERPFSIDDAADAVAALLGHLGLGPATVVGYSLGSAVAQAFADRHPARTVGLVLAAGELDPRRRPWKRAGIAAEGWLTGARRLSRGRWLSHRLVSKAARNDPGAERLRAWAVERFEHGHPASLRDAGRALRRFDGRPLAARRTAPAVVVVTERDRLSRPRQQRRLARAWDAPVVSLDADHDAPLARPDAFRVAIRTALARLALPGDGTVTGSVDGDGARSAAVGTGAVGTGAA